MTLATRDRLISAATSLFAERGVQAVAVGDIEERAGLTRRGGAFYKHFRSKDDVLQASLEREIRQMDGAGGLMELLPLGDVAAELTLLGRWLLANLNGLRPIFQILEREGNRVPELRDRMREELVNAGHRLAAGLAQRWLKDTPASGIDVDAAIVVLLGALIDYRRMQWTFGDAPLDVDEERFLRTWLSMSLHLLAAARNSLGPSERKDT